MKNTPLHPKEGQRLGDLYTHKILDTEADPAFDTLIDLASKVTRTPISMVSLMDQNRQWFKAHKGLNCQETPREISFCTYSVSTGDILIVEDAQLDSRFQSNPLVLSEPFIRFYIGIPLISDQGFPLGTFCVSDVKPRKLSIDQIEILSNLAKVATDLIKKHKKIIELSHTSAQTVRNTQKTNQAGLSSAQLFTLNEIFRSFAHEFNNPLAVGFGASEQLREMMEARQTKENEIEDNLIEQIHRSFLRTSKLVKSFFRLLLSKPGNAITSYYFDQFVEDLKHVLNNSLLVREIDVTYSDLSAEVEILIPPPTYTLLISSIIFSLLPKERQLPSGSTKILLDANHQDQIFTTVVTLISNGEVIGTPQQETEIPAQLDLIDVKRDRIKEMVDLLNGSFEVKSRAKVPYQVTLKIPIAYESGSLNAG